MPSSADSANNAMWCDRQKMANLINQTITFMGMIAKRSGTRTKSHNTAVDEWTRSTQEQVNQTITFDYANNIGVLAKYIRSTGQGGWFEFDEDEYLTLKKIMLNPNATEVSHGDIDAMRLQLSKFKEMAARIVSPKDPKPNDIMAAAVINLTFGDKMTEYKERFSKPIPTSGRRAKREDSDNKAERRNEMMSSLIENLFQALAVGSTPLDVLDGDEKHNKDRTSSTDLQIQTIANGLALIVREIIRTKKNADESERQAIEVEKGTNQFTAQFTLKVRENILAKNKIEIERLQLEVGSAESNLKDAQRQREELAHQLSEQESAAREQASELKQKKQALDEVTRQVSDISMKLEAAQQEYVMVQQQLKEKDVAFQEKDSELMQRTEALDKATRKIEDISSQLDAAKKEQSMLAEQLQKSEEAGREQGIKIKELTEQLEKSTQKIKEVTDQLGRIEESARLLGMEKSRLEEELEESKRLFEEKERALVVEQRAHEETKRALQQERELVGEHKEKIVELTRRVEQLQEAAPTTEETKPHPMSRLMVKNEGVETEEERSRLIEENKRLQQDNRELQSQLREQMDRNRKLESQLRAPPQEIDVRKIDTMPKVNEEQVEKLINEIIEHHKQVSSQRKHILGRLFKGAHTGERLEYFKSLEKIKLSKIRPEGKLIQVNEATEEYINTLAKGKSVRYLQNMIEFVEGIRPNEQDMKERWDKYTSKDPVVDGLENILISKATEPEVRLDFH